MKINFLFLVLLNCTTAFFTRPYIYRVSKIYLKNNELEGNEYYLELHLSNKNNTSKPGYPKQSNMNISYPPIDDIESEESLRKYKQSLFGGDQQPEKKTMVLVIHLTLINVLYAEYIKKKILLI